MSRRVIQTRLNFKPTVVRSSGSTVNDEQDESSSDGERTAYPEREMTSLGRGKWSCDHCGYNANKSMVTRHILTLHGSSKQRMDHNHKRNADIAERNKRQSSTSTSYNCPVTNCFFSGNTTIELSNHRSHCHARNSNTGYFLRKKMDNLYVEPEEKSSQDFRSLSEKERDFEKFKATDYQPLDNTPNYKACVTYLTTAINTKEDVNESNLRDFLHGNRSNKELEIEWYPGQAIKMDNTSAIPRHHLRVSEECQTELNKRLKQGWKVFSVKTLTFDTGDNFENMDGCQFGELYYMTVGFYQRGRNPDPTSKRQMELAKTRRSQFPGPSMLISNKVNPITHAHFLEEKKKSMLDMEQPLKNNPIHPLYVERNGLALKRFHWSEEFEAKAQKQAALRNSGILCLDKHCQIDHNADGFFPFSMNIHLQDGNFTQVEPKKKRARIIEEEEDESS